MVRDSPTAHQKPKYALSHPAIQLTKSAGVAELVGIRVAPDRDWRNAKSHRTSRWA
jgi:hypothetical protein